MTNYSSRLSTKTATLSWNSTAMDKPAIPAGHRPDATTTIKTH
jgi:hypothetical protein